MKEHGVEATSLSSTIQVFIDMGKPFANPICPVSTATTAALVPTASPSQRINPMPTDVIEDPSPTANPQPGDQMAPEGRPACTMGKKVYISSHRGKQLQDKYGYVRFSKNKNKWEQWTLSDAGDGKVFITSHRSEQLADDQGKVVMSSRKRDLEKWKLTNAGNGKVYITGHQNKHLQDNASGDQRSAQLSSNAGDWEAFTITDNSGVSACTVAA